MRAIPGWWCGRRNPHWHPATSARGWRGRRNGWSLALATAEANRESRIAPVQAPQAGGAPHSFDAHRRPYAQAIAAASAGNAAPAHASGRDLCRRHGKLRQDHHDQPDRRGVVSARRELHGRSQRCRARHRQYSHDRPEYQVLRSGNLRQPARPHQAYDQVSQAADRGRHHRRQRSLQELPQPRGYSTGKVRARGGPAEGWNRNSEC